MTITHGNGVGWYGKVPALGDFVSRGLPTSFVEGWDAWLRRALLHGRGIDAARFDAALASFPTWRFLVAPDVLGACGWCGVLQASTDRVGRLFPLTIAQALPLPADGVCDTTWLEGQLDDVARVAVSALDQSSLGLFERLVDDLAVPPVFAGAASIPTISDARPGVDRSNQGLLTMTGRLDRMMRAAGERELARLLSHGVLWWIPPGADDHGAALRVDAPMPDDLLWTLLDAV